MRSIINVIKLEVIRPWMCAALLIVITFPMWLWERSPNIMVWASLILLILALKDIIHNRKYWNAGLFVFFIQVIFLGRYFILSDTNINGYIMVLLRGGGFATIFLCSHDFWRKTTDCFIKLLAFLLILAIIEHIAIIFLGSPIVDPYYLEECPINPDREYSVFLFNVYLTQTLDFTEVLRFSAFFDEPGVLGNIVMVLLYIQKFNLKKWYNIILLVSGILSFSLAFYFSVGAYFILFGNFRLKIAFLLVLVLAVVFFYGNEDIYKLVFRRIEFENGTMVGYNREINTDLGTWLKRISLIDYFFWGYHPKTAIPYAASWRWAFVMYGVIPSLIYFLALTVPRFKMIRNRTDVLLGMILVIIIWIQRPFLQLYLYSYLLAIPFIYLSGTYKKTIRVQKNA